MWKLTPGYYGMGSVSQTHAHIFQPLDECKAILTKLIKVRQLLHGFKKDYFP
jgi:hypothetical protein